MAQFDKINNLQIGNHVWYFTSPQIIKWEKDGESVTMRAVLRIQHEEHLTHAAPDAGGQQPQVDETEPPAQVS